MRRICVLSLVTMMAVSAQASGQPPSSSVDMVHIDGSKNPELIPQWNVWAFTFRIIAGGTKQIPTPVLDHLSEQEAALVLKAAEEDEATTADCQKKILAMRPLLRTEKAEVINQKTRELQLECRQRTLDTRDRLLASLADPGRNALSEFVESMKSGMKVSVPKKELAHYRHPQ